MDTARQKLRKARDWFIILLAKFVYKYKPESLENMMRSEANKLAQDLALRLTMAYLDKERILHCAACPQRMGLVRKTI